MSTCAVVRSFIESKTTEVQTSNAGFTSEVSDYLVVHTGPGADDFTKRPSRRHVTGTLIKQASNKASKKVNLQLFQYDQCGTRGALWLGVSSTLQNLTLPQAGEETQGDVCLSEDCVSTCSTCSQVTVRHCGSFFVYWLQGHGSCSVLPTAYCVELIHGDGDDENDDDDDDDDDIL